MRLLSTELKPTIRRPIIFLSYYFHHPILHSFPTRRSSDLDWTHIEPLLDEAMHVLDDTDRAAVLLRYFEKDRKSTRLNSSHQIISYAVFCLKKKRYWLTWMRRFS